MIIPGSQLLDLYRAVKLDTHQSEDKSVLIFVANGDVDSLCAVQQLENILGRSDFTYAIHPVENYDAVAQTCRQEQLQEAQDLKTVFMINCGATEVVRDMCQLSPNVRVIIIDSHRPVWHGYNNAADADTVVVVDDDDPVTPADIPIADDLIAPGDSSSEDEGSSSSGSDGGAGLQGRATAQSDDESSQGGGGGGKQSGRQDGDSRKRGRSSDASEGGDGPESSGGHAGGSPAARQGQKQPARERRHAAGGPSDPSPPRGAGGAGPGAGPPSPRTFRRQERAKRRQEALEHSKAVDAYYLGKAGYGKPSSLLLHGLARDQQEDDCSHVWLAILGLTDQYVHQRVDPMQYEGWRRQLVAAVARASHVFNLPPDADEDDEGGLAGARAKHQLYVRPITDLKVPLLRGWTLFDALKHTHHIATRMQTWRDVGVKQLEVFLSHLGIGPSQHHAEFLSMSPHVMPHLERHLQPTSSRFRLVYDALRYQGFEMQYKNWRVLASDYVLAITAILGRSRSTAKPHEIYAEALACLQPHTLRGWRALEAGLADARSLARTVVEEGGLIITRGQVQGGKHAGLWVCDLSVLSLQAAAVLEQPSSLLRLALFLRDARAQRLSRVKPLVMVGPTNPATGMCYVVAIRATQQAGVMQNNPFSVPFQEALKELDLGDAKSMATFDNAVFLIKQSAVPGFIEELKGVVQAYRSAAGAEDGVNT